MSSAERERLFFALWPTAQQLDTLKQQTESIMPVQHGRKLPLNNLHITLSFLGSVDIARRADIIKQAEAINVSPFSITLNKFSYHQRQRMLWLEAETCPESLSILVTELREKMSGLGIEQETRPFLPHITLIRKLTRYDRSMLEHRISCLWEINEYVLVRSKTYDTGAEYEIVHRFSI